GSPQSFCVVPHNRASRHRFSLLALGTEQDSRRARGLKPACLTGAFSANQRKRPDPRRPPDRIEKGLAPRLGSTPRHPVSSGSRREYLIACEPYHATQTGWPRRLPRIRRAVREDARLPVRAVTSIIKVGWNAWRRVHADDTGVLVDAADYYHAVYWAISRAQSHVLMSGWQFDSGVPLLRGADVPSGADVRFLKFLDGLCRRRPELRVYLLAWDFHLIFAGEREWLQRVIFHWMTSPHLRFRFADHPAAGGSHHQKFVVVDGGLAFLGGMDVCEARWDDRRHLADNPLRLSHGRPQKPYHDLQAWLGGGAAGGAPGGLFSPGGGGARGARRRAAPALELRSADRPEVPVRASLPIGGTTVALSRTDPQPDGNTIREVERLFEDAIAAAARLIYGERQDLSSRRMREGLVRRMRTSGRPQPEIVIIVNEQAEALKEELAVGLRQARNLEVLRDTASR